MTKQESTSVKAKLERPSARQHRTLVGLEEKVAFLSQPDSYPEAPRRVESIETHMAWVFLTDRYAYKLKKPVRYAFLDFSTLEARRRDSEAEVRLNRRLARDVYLGTIPLVLDAEGTLHLGGEGESVDWLVQMRRLPANRMLDYAITHQTIREKDIQKVVTTLAAFYQRAVPVSVGTLAYRARFESDIRATQRVLATPSYGLPLAIIERTAASQLELLQREPALFDQRVLAQRIIDAHGDLRPEHICLEPEPVIIDCLEFNRTFRLMDPADELAFLSMECERLGAPWVQELVFATYGQITGDGPSARLVRFYKSYRACLRARLSIWHLDDANVSERDRWTNLARVYLDLANKHRPDR